MTCLCHSHLDIFCGRWGDKCPNHCQPLTLWWELAYCSGLGVTGERKRLGILSRERGWFGVLGQDPRQKVCCGSRTFQKRVRGILKYMFPLMFSTRGKPWWCHVSAHVKRMSSSSSSFTPSPPAVPGHLYQRVHFPVAQGRADGVFSTEEDSSLSSRRWLGRSWLRFPSICFGGGLLLFIWF